MKPTSVCYWFYWLLLTSHCCGWLVSLLRVLTVLAWCFLPQFVSIVNKYPSLKFSSLCLHFLRVHYPVSYLYNKFLDLDFKGVLVTFISFSITLLKNVFIVVVTMVISNIFLARHDMAVTCNPSSWEAEADRQQNLQPTWDI